MSGEATAKVVIVGGGFGGIQAAKGLAHAPVRVTLYDRQNHHVFQPLLYQVALGGLGGNEIATPIRAVLGSQPNVRVVLAEVVSVDLPGRRLLLGDGCTVPYDYLVLSAGARTNYYGHDGWAAHAPGLKDLEDAYEIRRRVLVALESAEREGDAANRRRLMTFVVIGGGPTGVELAGAIADLAGDILRRDFRQARPEDLRVVLIEMAPRILGSFAPSLSTSAVRQLAELRVDVRPGAAVTDLDEHGVTVSDGELIPCATVLWTAGVRPAEIGRTLGVALDRSGRVIVEPDCSVPGHPEAFVIGDLAAFTPRDRDGHGDGDGHGHGDGQGRPPALPGVAPVAIQQGRAVAANIARSVRGEARQPFVYFDKGTMAAIGRGRAIAEYKRLHLSGLLAWLAWIGVHLWYLVGFRNRLLVFFEWFWQLITARYGARVITGYEPPRPGKPATIATMASPCGPGASKAPADVETPEGERTFGS
jgi:NADH dehydrogenase